MSRSTAESRKRQIDTLKIFNDNVMEIKPNEEYSVGFNSAGRTFQLDVFLSPNFPNENPTLVLSPTVIHQWVQSGSGTVQNAPGLLNFTVHSDLGRVVRAIISEFERSIPHMSSVDSSQQSSSSSSSSSTTTPTTNQKIVPSSYEVPAGSKVALDKIANVALPDLASMPLDELTRLHNDPAALSDCVEELSIIQDLSQTMDTLMEDLVVITEENLSKESQLKELRLATEQLRATMRSLGERYDSANKRYQEKAEQFAPTHIKELLQIAVSTAESDSEIHVDDFLSGKIEASTFLDRYIKMKVLATMRKAKADRLAHQLNALERATF